jgi:hypothetical protein
MIKTKSPAASVVVVDPKVKLIVFEATVNEVLPAAAFVVSVVYAFTTVFAAVIVKSPFLPLWENRIIGEIKEIKKRSVFIHA